MYKLLILFLKSACNVFHLEELMCYDCCFSLYCNCILEGNCFYHIISMLNHTISSFSFSHSKLFC